MEYEDYIRSPEWRARKRAFYSRYPKRCAICGAERRIELHHITYRRLCEELDDDLLPLCKTHHRELHEFAGYQCRENTFLFLAQYPERTQFSERRL